jgi:hypothetical protein
VTTNSPDSWYWYAHRSEPMRYGHSDATYAKTIGWLAQSCATIQDWGAGMGYARRFAPEGVAYTAVDWAPGTGADITADLATWRPDPAPDGILLRHVLEHVDDWPSVLAAAATTARKRLAIVIFTPFAPVTRRLTDGWEIDWSFRKADLEDRLVGRGLTVTQEHVDGTGTQYDAGEHIFYAERLRGFLAVQPGGHQGAPFQPGDERRPPEPLRGLGDLPLVLPAFHGGFRHPERGGDGAPADPRVLPQPGRVDAAEQGTQLEQGHAAYHGTATAGTWWSPPGRT